MNAQEAKSAALAVQPKVIDRLYDEIKQGIENSAKDGFLELEVDLKIYSEPVKKGVLSKLREDGFQTSSYGHGTTRVSWE